MPIDWFTVAAQILNFLILIVFLRRFLYGPILRAIDAREARITAELQAAEDKQKEAELEAELYRRKNLELERTRDGLVREARGEVQAWRDELMRKAHREAQEAQARWRRGLEDEKEAYLRQLQQRVSHQAYVVARRALAELAEADLEAQVIRAFVERLSTLGSDERAAIAGEAAQPGQEVVVTSAFQLDTRTRREIEATVREHFGAAGGLRFEVSPDLVCGIELRTQGHRVAWSVADYLTALEVHSTLSMPGQEVASGGSHGR